MNEPAASRGKIWIEYSTRMDALIDDNKDEKDKLKFLKRIGTTLSAWLFVLNISIIKLF